MMGTSTKILLLPSVPLLVCLDHALTCDVRAAAGWYNWIFSTSSGKKKLTGTGSMVQLYHRP